MFCCALLYVHSSFAIILMGKRELVAFLVSRDCCVVLPRGAICLSAVCDCGIFLSYSFSVSEYMHAMNTEFCSVLVYSFESNQLGKPSFKKGKFILFHPMHTCCNQIPEGNITIQDAR